MRPLLRKYLPVGLVGLAVLAAAPSGCESSKAPATAPPDGGPLRYVGIDSCRTCHADIYDDYIHTGMGRSFRPARPQLSDARFPSPVLFDSARAAYYRAFTRNDSIFIEEFRIDPATGDTFFHRIQPVDYIVGSGHHTNSHIYHAGGYLYQAPLTFYTQDSLWDFPPGFHGGHAVRWHRPIGLECMTCHNALPHFDTGSLNRYHAVPLGIDCERCHGPGSRHVARRRAGLPFDSGEIVHPARLSPARQMDLCARCHLQGLAVLRSGKTFTDFHPGMALADVWNVYYPRSWLDDSLPIMASHPLRLRMSRCYRASWEDPDVPELTCLSCHNPHQSVRRTPRRVFIQKCFACHAEADCTAPADRRAAESNDCITCHMPLTRTHDIPHVRIHDHYIRIPGTASPTRHPLVAPLVDTAPPLAERARAVLDFVDRFRAPTAWLDSVEPLMAQLHPRRHLNEWLYYTFLRRQLSLTTALFLRARYPEDSLWTFSHYRLGEAYLLMGNPTQARYYFTQALRRLPHHPPFHLKVGVTWMYEQKPRAAIPHFRKAVDLDPSYPAAWNNLGFAYLLTGRLDSAQYCIQQALQLSAENPHAWANLLKLYFLQGRMEDYAALKARLRRIYPHEKLFPQVWQALESASR